MGNRFREEPEYHNLIRAHGVVAAITFLLIVPSAIMIARFYGRNPRLALRYHIWLQILTLLLTTVIFILGWIAVGPARSLTNPHHAIGLTIFVLVLFQFLFGWWVHRRERNKRKTYEPLKIMVGSLVFMYMMTTTDNVVSSLDRSLDRPSRARTNTVGTCALRISEIFVHSVYTGCFRTPPNLFYPNACERKTRLQRPR